MIDFQHLCTGIGGIANTHGGGTMAGDLGAATVSRYFFAAAIAELDRFGYKEDEEARRGLPAHHQSIRLWRSLPDVESELGAVVSRSLPTICLLNHRD